jgi:hypothetical protein
MSPIAAIPHKSRAYRMILDLSYALHTPDTNNSIPSVNFSTSPSALYHAMYKLGNVIPRLIQLMASAPPTHPLLFAKVDLKDGFW